VTDGDLVADDKRVGIVGDMEDTKILYVRPVADPDRVHVSANHSVEPDATMFAHYNIADDDTGFLDKTGGGNSGFDALECPDHEVHCRRINR